MKKLIRSSKSVKASFNFGTVESIAEVVTDSLKDSIDSGEFYTYDDVVSEVYAQIQQNADDVAIWTESDEDEAFDIVMDELQRAGYINESAGTVTPRG